MVLLPEGIDKHPEFLVAMVDVGEEGGSPLVGVAGIVQKVLLLGVRVHKHN